ncbi:PhoH family protein [Brevibacterium sp. BRM-1]|uniref:PhoH family protein n=1 Tax=Brevibacterium sp. BRM-1 TaxID=2999062 RepID=UPI002E167692
MRIALPEDLDLTGLYGPADVNLRTLEELAPGTRIHVRQRDIAVSGPRAEVDALVETLGQLRAMAVGGARIDPETVRRIHRMDARGARPADVLGANILSHRGTSIRPKTFGQHEYVRAIREHTITFGLGPAGTGKTYLAMAMAVSALQRREVSRIILTRPAVEAGERLGFLPGTLGEKIDPYVRPLYDALHDMIEPEKIKLLLDSGVIEVAPLAYMRGRTLNDAFIILDEAQNTTAEQMKMFLTRLGFGSRMVVTGDTSQVDLPGGTRSGLMVVQSILAGVEEIAFEELTSKDVVRHSLVTAIVDAYDLYGARAQRPAGGADRGPEGHRGHRGQGRRGAARGADSRGGDGQGGRA